MASSMLTAQATSSAPTESKVDEALNTAKHSCANDPDFAVICDFLQKFSKDLGLDLPNFKQLLDWVTKIDEVSPQLREMQIKLLRKTRKTVHEKSWESALSKFCFTYSAQDAWEIERFGYKNSSFKVKLRILRELLESQFERNSKFRAKVLTISADALRSQPIGRDRLGHAYWMTQDNDCNLRIYQEHLDEEIWQVVATNREEFVNLITRLKRSEVVLPSVDIGIVDEDTSSSSSSRTCSESIKNPQEEQCDSQEDEQKVPKLSIKILHGKNSKDGEPKDVGKGEEELADEEDAKLIQKAVKSEEATESDEEEFEEVEEEYESESEDEDDDIDEDDDEILKKDKSELEKVNSPVKVQNEALDDAQKVKPLLISQNKIVNLANSPTNAAKKRTLDQVDSNPSNCSENQQIISQKKLRPSLLDSKRSKTQNKYEESKNDDDIVNEEGDEEDDDIEEEVEEEDIDSVAAEEDENEEKQFEDFDDEDDEEDEVGEEISDPVLRVVGEGSGKDCEVGNIYTAFEYDLCNDENEFIVSDVIEEDCFYILGDGYGKECMVGNNKCESETSNTANKKDDSTEVNLTLTSTQVETVSEKPVGEPSCPLNKDDSKEDSSINKLTDKKEHETENLPKQTESVKEIKNETLENINDEISQVNGGNNQKDSKKETTTESILDPSDSKDLKDSKEQLITGIVDEKKSDDEKLDCILKKDDKIVNKTKDSPISKPESLASSTTEQIHASKMSVLESLKKELRESKQKSMVKNALSSTVESNKTKLSNPLALNRKRRLDDLTSQQTIRPSNSESEIEVNSENPEDLPRNESEVEIGDLDIGGKRLKMRSKQTNSELRKKIEAQKVAANEETTSSSGGEEESRRRRKTTSPKKQGDQTLTKSEEIDTKIEPTKKSTNGGGKREGVPLKIGEKASIVTKQPSPVKNLTQITTGKNKPTLAEIIEKKLKKTPEKIDKASISASLDEKSEAVSSTKSKFPSSNKSPITKPLKKNLLSQLRQEESDEEAVPRKRTTSEDLVSAVSSDFKAVETNKPSKDIMITNDAESSKNTPERQRKRRSSEETAQNVASKEPESKKEVDCEGLKNETDIKKNKTNLINEETLAVKKECNVKKESIPEDSTPVTGRRSGRRGGLTTAFVEIPQPKRTRGCSKTYTKSDVQDVESCEENKKELKVETKLSITLEDKKKKEESKRDTNEKPSLKEESHKKDQSQKELNVKELNKGQMSKAKAQISPKSPVKGLRKQGDVDTTNIIEVTDNETPVRQSRRIAQQKIREEAERRKLEEIALRTMKQELKKKKKAEKQADPTIVPPSEPSSETEESDVETKKKVQKKKCPGKNGSWSSGSEEQEEPEEEDEEPPHYEVDPGSPLFKSDHEFSPESDIEDESQAVPMKRARTVRKEDAADDAADDEAEACQKCNKSDHPEWILLCDNCDKGYHCSCLSPVLFYIPEGDWYCPPCQQDQLIKALECQLKEFDDLVDNKKKEEEREKLLAEEEKARQEEETRKQKKNKKTNKTKKDKGESSDECHSNSSQEEDTGRSSDESADKNVRKSSSKSKNTNRSKNNKKSDKRNHRDRRQSSTRNIRNRVQKRSSDSDTDSQHKPKRTVKTNSSSSSSSSSSSTYSESDNEPIYKLRKRRQINVSYRINEYDDLIDSALKKEMDEAAGAGNLGRGKDISTIIEADKEEKARKKQMEDGSPSKEQEKEVSEGNEKELATKSEENVIKTVVEKSEEKKEAGAEDSDDEPINQKFQIKPALKKKSRKLTTLDISSGDDDGSDEDFKGSSLDDEDDEDTSISASNSDSSLEIYKRHGKSKKKRRKAARKTLRRQRRKDRKFIVDETDDDDEVQRPKSKKKRKDDSDYTESDADDDDLSDLSENIDSADLCDDTTTDESDGAWRPNNRKKAKKSNTPFVQKPPKEKKPETKKPKKVEYSDDDISETEEEEDEEENDGVGGGKGMGGKQPRSQPLKTSSSAAKTKTKGKGGTSTKTKKKKKSSEDDVSLSDSGDSTRRTRGRRYAYIEDFDDSSDGGIKPGVQRPDTPPEEREKFIKRQEEIKRMLAEKNAEGAKLVATPRLTPIKTDSEKDKRSPVKASLDSLSTVPLSVIRQAKVLDIDYLQRRGESLDDLSNDVGEVDDDFDDADLPDDLPEDMDEDTIARMVEEEEEFGAAAARELPAPDEVLRVPPSVKPKIKEFDNKPNVAANATPVLFSPTPQQIPVNLPTSGLQEPVRKRLPMPTMHPPLLRHQFLLHESMSNAQHLMQRHSGAPTSHLLQSALCAPLTQPLDRNYPPSSPSASHHSLLNRMTHSMSLQPTVPHAIGTTRPHLPNITKSTGLSEHPGQEKSLNIRPEAETKPRGRRKKITPLRDTLQKQQAAAAVTAATANNSAMASTNVNATESISASIPSSVIRSGPPSIKGDMPRSVITSMPPSTQSIPSRPPVSGLYARSDGPRFYDPLGNRPGVQRQRGSSQMPPSLLPPHPAIRSSYGAPPPLKGSSSGTANSPISGAPGTIRTPMHHVPPYVGMPPSARHSAQHLNLYSRPSIYGNPAFGPRVNLRPPNIHSSEYSAGSRAYSPYGFYPPPPPLTTPGQGPPSAQMSQAHMPIHSQPSTSVIVSAAAAAPSTSTRISPRPSPPVLSEPVSKSATASQVLPVKVSPSRSPLRVSQGSKLVAEPRKKLTTLQAFSSTNTAKKSPLTPTGGSPGSQASPRPQAEAVEDSSSTPGTSDNPAPVEQSRAEGHASEFSGLVSYFSSQHDDYNT